MQPLSELVCVLCRSEILCTGGRDSFMQTKPSQLLWDRGAYVLKPVSSDQDSYRHCGVRKQCGDEFNNEYEFNSATMHTYAAPRNAAHA